MGKKKNKEKGKNKKNKESSYRRETAYERELFDEESPHYDDYGLSYDKQNPNIILVERTMVGGR